MQCSNREEDAPLEWRAPSASPSLIKKLTNSEERSVSKGGDTHRA
jgi:hypothetical protein